MSEATLVQQSPARKRRTRGEMPRPIAPEQDARVDAQALTFEWAANDGRDFVLEVARDAAFHDVVTRLPTGLSTSVTVYDVFRPDGSRYYWRVSSGQVGAGEVRSFVAATYQQASAAGGAVADVTTRAPQSRAARRDASPPVDPPYRSGATSTATVVTVVLVMMISFFVTLGLLYTIALGM